MASMNLIVAFLAIVALAAVESKPMLGCKKACPDTLIRNYFDEVRITVDSDFSWIVANMKYIAAKKEAAEYAAIANLLAQLEAAKRTFDTDYTTVQTEIYERVAGFQSKYGLLSISYTERIVIIRKTTRQRLYPDLRAFRALYVQMLPLFNDFYSKYNLERLIRARACPRAPEYNVAQYLPWSTHTGEVTGIVQTPWKDYQYVRDLLNKLDYAKGTPEYDLKLRLSDQMIDAWIEFNNNRRDLEITYYPRFVDAGDDIKAIDAIYLDYIRDLRGFSTRYAYTFFDVYGQVEDIYVKNNLPYTSYMDFDLIGSEADVRGMYLPSKRLQNYYTKLIVTSRMDYLTAKRMWDNLNYPKGSPEWELRNKVLPELKARLDKLELLLNRNIRNAFLKTYDFWQKNPQADFDAQYDSVILEIITSSDRDILPLVYEYREQYYINDDMLADLLKKKGIIDATRNIIPCSTYGYDNTIAIPDKDLRDLFRWAEKLMKTNYYGPMNDLLQLRFDEGTEEWKIRRDAIKRLEAVWLEYRKIQNYAIRKYVDLLGKRRVALNSPEYNKEIKAIREYCRPRFVEVINRFKKDCFDINAYLDQLYAKTTVTGCTRSYVYIEQSFTFTTKTTVKSCSSC